MTTSAVCELWRANADALDVAVRRTQEGATGDNVAEIADSLEDLVETALHNAALERRNWDRTKAALAKGMAAYQARPLVDNCVQLGGLHERALATLHSMSLELKKHGVEASRTNDLAAALAEARARLASTREVLELLDRPGPPLDREQLRLSRESFLRGGGRGLDDILAERQGPRS